MRISYLWELWQKLGKGNQSLSSSICLEVTRIKDGKWTSLNGDNVRFFVLSLWVLWSSKSYISGTMPLQTSRGSRSLILLGNLVILIPNLLKFICIWVDLSHSYLSKCYFCKNLIICIHIYIIKYIYFDFYIKIFIYISIYIFYIYILIF